jgi:riboflavin synthase
MFTGLIESIGVIKARTGGKTGKLVISSKKKFTDLAYGESIAVNGACLTLEQVLSNGDLEFHCLAETFQRTNLGKIPIGGVVNLERALRLGDRLGGHLVTGHIDATAVILNSLQTENDFQFTVTIPEGIDGLLVEKGSIAIDGISLTIAKLTNSNFTVCIIPVTIRETALISRSKNDVVNLETDLLGKYVQKYLVSGTAVVSNLTIDKLKQAGWQ